MTSRRVPLRAAGTRRWRALWLPRAITDADVVISMPEDEDASLAGLTLSLKNCFGCVPGPRLRLAEERVALGGTRAGDPDVAAAVRPDYAIVDGIVGMEGNGPISGTPVAPNVLVLRRRSGGDGRGRRACHGIRPAEGHVPGGGGAVPRARDMDRIRTEGEDVDDVTTDFAVLRGSRR